MVLKLFLLVLLFPKQIPRRLRTKVCNVFLQNERHIKVMEQRTFLLNIYYFKIIVVLVREQLLVNYWVNTLNTLASPLATLLESQEALKSMALNTTLLKSQILKLILPRTCSWSTQKLMTTITEPVSQQSRLSLKWAKPYVPLKR